MLRLVLLTRHQAFPYCATNQIRNNYLYPQNINFDVDEHQVQSTTRFAKWDSDCDFISQPKTKKAEVKVEVKAEEPKTEAKKENEWVEDADGNFVKK